MAYPEGGGVGTGNGAGPVAVSPPSSSAGNDTNFSGWPEAAPRHSACRMSTRAQDGFEALTDKEKQTLRLIVRGHDAKSIARHLDLSVHTINERLRDARRKLTVSSSREAARLLLAREGGTPESLADNEIGAAAAPDPVPPMAMPETGDRRIVRRAGIFAGATLMTFILGILVLAAQPQPGVALADGPPATGVAADAAVEASARQWLALLDQGRWDDSWRATGAAFRKLNTSRTWADVSKKVRAPLGAVVSRALISQENLPAPPRGYEVVKFRTSFANQADAVETVTLEREDGGWRVVGITVG